LLDAFDRSLEPVRGNEVLQSVRIGGPSDGKLEPADVVLSIDEQRPAEVK
jgi:hypothetical protein